MANSKQNVQLFLCTLCEQGSVHGNCIVTDTIVPCALGSELGTTASREPSEAETGTPLALGHSFTMDKLCKMLRDLTGVMQSIKWLS